LKLRLRLALTSLAVTLPTIAALYMLDARARHGAAEQLLAQAMATHMHEPGERERCEADPGAWGGVPLGPPAGPSSGPKPGPERPPPGDEPHGAAPVLFAYATDLRSRDPDAPALDPELVAALGERASASPASLWPDDDVYVLLRMPWSEGPCALILAHGTTTAGWLGAILPARPIWLIPALAVFVGLLIAAGPIVRRIRRLADLVQSSAADGFDKATVLDGSDEVAELSQAFDMAASTVRAQLEENQRRERALREFVANTTHDVMTPLTVLADHLTTLEEQARAGQRSDVATLTAAMDEVHYMASIIENLSLAAKLDSTEPVSLREQVELDAVVERVVARHRPIARKLGVELDYGLANTPVIIDADLTMLEQALGNVVQNAIRYNEAGGHVAVLVERPSAEHFRVRVLDDGPGIPEADLRRLIARGARGDAARTREPRGQGLGLAIAFRVAELHGFALELGRSEYGGLQVELSGRCPPLAPTRPGRSA
jgi:two-component system sensor histidine kinase BaeS